MIKKILFVLIFFLLRSSFGDEINQVYGKCMFKDGKVGKAAYFDGNNFLQYSINYIKANAGSIEIWVRTDEPLEKIEFLPLISVGTNSPLWFLTGLNKGSIFFLYKNGKSPFRKEGEFYTSVKVKVKKWDKDKWHHIAFVWGNTGKEKSFIQIYVDGKLKEARYNLTIGKKWQENIKFFGVGYNTASAKGKKFKGLIDELRISNIPRTKKEIKSDFETGENGKNLKCDKNTLLYISFDDNLKGESKTEEIIKNEEIYKRLNEIIKEEMYGRE